MAAKIFRINYKSDFILTLNSDAGWAIPFCIKFWTSVPSRAYFVGYDGTTYTHCSYDPSEPTKLVVQFDDHHLPIGDLNFQIAYHFTVADFPNDTEDEVINPAAVTTEIDGETYHVMLDFTGETAPEIEFNLPAYANEAERIDNELQRQQNEAARIEAELQREQATAAAVEGAENVNAQLNGTTLTVTNRNGVSTSVNTKGEQGEQGPVGPEGPQGEQGETGISIVSFTPKSETSTTLIYTVTFSDGHTQDVAIPKGAKGDTGATGPQGPQGDTGVSITGFVETGETETATLYNITFSNGTTQQVSIPKGEKGDTGEQGPVGPQGPQGPMGDVAVITPEQQAAFTMYSEPGQNTNGPMTQKAVTDNYGYKPTGHNGYAINLGVGIGNTVGSEAVDQYSTGTEIKVSEGDVILVTAQGGNNSRAWGFIDENRVLLSVAYAAKFYEDEVLIAPAGADKVVLNAVILNTPGGIIGYPNYEWYLAKADSVGADAILAKFAQYTKYDNLQSGLTAENVQGALDEIHGETVLTNNTGFNPLNESQYNANLTNIRITVANGGFTAEVIRKKGTSTADYVAGITCTSLKAGKTYEIEFDYVSGWSGSFQIRDTSFNTDGNIFGVHTAGSGHISIVKTLTSDSGSFTFLLPQNTVAGKTLVVSNLVITEVTSLKDKVNDIEAELNDNLKHQITPVVGSYYKLDVEIGSVADTIVSNAAWQYARIPVEEGDVVCITGYSGEIPRLWGYLDSDYTLLDVASALEIGNKLVKVIPSGVSYIVINSSVSSHPQWYYAKVGSAGADELLAYKTQQKLDAIYEGVDISEQFVFTNNAGIASDTTPPGHYAENSSFTLWKATQGFVDISQYNYILVTVPNIYYGSLGTAFYTEANEQSCVYAEGSTVEGAGRIKVKSYDVSNYNYMRITFTQGNNKFSCIASIRQNYQSIDKNANEILVAASDAPSDIKAQADFICTGSHDEVTIQNAINAYRASGKKDCIRLTKGVFNIDAFPHQLTTDEGTTYTALYLPNNGSKIPEFRIYGAGSTMGHNVSLVATSINVTQAAVNTIVSNAQYKVFGGEEFVYSRYSAAGVIFSDFDIHLPSNQYPILCLDMSLVNRVKIDRVFLRTFRGGTADSSWQRPVEGCIGLRMTSGSNWGIENDYRNIFAYGFYEGFQVGGESVLAENLGTINSVYGYTFGNYHWERSFNHKIIMLGISDERSENLPLFAESGYANSAGNARNTPFEVIMLGYETEFIPPVWSNNPINYATELHPGAYCGVITYTHESSAQANQVNIPFWAAGMGKNFKTSNSAQLEVTTKAILNTYAPNYNQIVYCTDLQKPLICTEPSTKEWRDFMGNVVNINS